MTTMYSTNQWSWEIKEVPNVVSSTEKTITYIDSWKRERRANKVSSFERYHATHAEAVAYLAATAKVKLEQCRNEIEDIEKAMKRLGVRL